jgi:hypothetical protein
MDQAATFMIGLGDEHIPGNEQHEEHGKRNPAQRGAV